MGNYFLNILTFTKMRPFALAMTVAATSAMSSEFIRGCETGIFIMSEDQMSEYACSEVEISREVHGYIDMITPMKMMFQNMNKGQSNPMIDFVDKSTHQIGMLYSLFSDEYDGGDFCQGLIFSHEAGQLMLNVGKSMFSGFMNKGGSNPMGAFDTPNSAMIQDLLQG